MGILQIISGVSWFVIIFMAAEVLFKKIDSSRSQYSGHFISFLHRWISDKIIDHIPTGYLNFIIFRIEGAKNKVFTKDDYYKLIVGQFFILLLAAVLWIFAILYENSSVVMMIPFLLPCLLYFTVIHMKWKISDRTNQFVRDLPNMIDYLCLLLNAGVDFKTSLRTLISDLDPGVMQEELAGLYQRMEMGVDSGVAFNTLVQRVQSSTVIMVFETIHESLRMGTDLVMVLEDMASFLHDQRFQKAEELAGKISVRMMLPMMLFIMPASVIILLGPMFLAGFYGGM